jgi:2-polyprenyl-3-methyl-5-hydroxy-6-metoxy-1,4-benzoquinol methylase
VSAEKRVRSHFDADAKRFDEIYENRKGPVRWFVDDVWRGVVQRRFALTLELLAPLDGKRVLDVGCGSGRYCIAFAQRGAAKVVGIDYAPAMLELAERHAVAAHVSAACEFRQAEFPNGVLAGERFDCATAMGYFDYVPDPAAHLARMKELTAATIVASFPKKRDLRAPLRRLRFKVNRCPLFLYSAAEVESVFVKAGIRSFERIDLGRDYVAVARLSR